MILRACTVQGAELQHFMYIPMMKKDSSGSTGWRYWLNLFFFGLAALGLSGLVGVIFTAYRSTLSYLHPPRRRLTGLDTPAALGIDYQEVELVTRDGIRLAAWYSPPSNGAVILIGHGLADARSAFLHAMFAENGYGVVAWDFRAHGQSGGEMTTLGYREALDVEAALDFSLEQEAVRQVGAWGGSMGGAAVIRAASNRKEIEAVVVDSAYACLEDELIWLVNYDIFTPFIRFFAERQTGLKISDLCPEREIERISPRPVLIIHGEADPVIPVSASERLFEAAGEPRFLWTEPAVGHVGMRSTYPEIYEDRVVGFFDDHLLNDSH